MPNIDDRGFGIIKELGRSYNIRVEQTGTQESMEKYGRLLEKAMQYQMHEEVRSDCEEWHAKQRKENQSKAFSTPLRTSSKSKLSSKQQKHTLTPAPKEFSLKDISFGQTPPSSLPRLVDSFDDTPQSDARTQDEEPDHSSSNSDDDEEDEYSQLVIDAEEENSSNDRPPGVVQLPTTTTSKKRASKPGKKTPVAKRLRFTMNDDEENSQDQQLDLHQLLNHIKHVNMNVLKLQKQQEQIKIILEHQDKFLNTLCINQKKLAKSFTRNKIPIILQDNDEDAAVVEPDPTDPEPIFTRCDGAVINLLRVHGTKENTVKYALKLIDLLFINKQDFQNVNVKKIDEDERIKAIYNAIQQKFNFSIKEMSVVWPPVHDSILSKRRNQAKALKSAAAQNMPLQNINHDDSEQQGYTDEQTNELK